MFTMKQIVIHMQLQTMFIYINFNFLHLMLELHGALSLNLCEIRSTIERKPRAALCIVMSYFIMKLIQYIYYNVDR